MNFIIKLFILFNFFNFIFCDLPLINYIEPLSQNDSILTIYGRFFGKTKNDTKVEIDCGKGIGFENINIKEWSMNSLVLNLNPPLPKIAIIKLTVLKNSINHTIHFMNPNCLGLTQCNGHGVCPNGEKCVCNPPWSGLDCSNIEGEDMLKLETGKHTIPLPNKLNQFNTSIGLVLREQTPNGYIINSYLLTPANQYGSINRIDFLVARYKTNTFLSSADIPFSCDITLNHYLANQTSSIGQNYIYQIKDGFGLAVIVKDFQSISNKNKLILSIYPMIKNNITSNPSNKSIDYINVSKIDNDDEIIKSDPSTTITKNNYDTVSMIINDQKLRSNIYDFGLVLGNFSTFNTSVDKLSNITKFYNINNGSSSSNNNSNDSNEIIELYSILSISSYTSKYLYFFSDYYSTKIEPDTSLIPTQTNSTITTPKPTITPYHSIKPIDSHHILDEDLSDSNPSSLSTTPTKSNNVHVDTNNSNKITKIGIMYILILFSIFFIF